MGNPGRLFADLPVRPQIIRNAPLLTFFLKGDVDRLRTRLPPPLRPHERARLVLNMWFLAEPYESTGFGSPGPLGVTYLAAEVSGEEGASADGSARFPGRFWLEHWNSSSKARQYAYEASGLHMRPGHTLMTREHDVLSTQLRLGRKMAIAAHARIGSNRIGTSSGYSIYYAERKAPSGGREVARLDVPWIADAYSASDAAVEFSFSNDDPSLTFVANGPQSIEAVSFRRMTLVPYLAQGVVGESI
jgi:hypothetical protein